LYKLFLTLRYLRGRRIAYFAVAAVTLCVMMVLIVMSVMGGWLEQIKIRARGLLGDIVVDNRAYSGFPLYEEFIAEISTWPEVEQATPVIYTYGLVQFPGTAQNGMVQVVGIRLEEIYRVNTFKSGLFYEQYYPGTTSLAEQQQPLIGVDLEGEPIALSSGRLVPPVALPEPFQSALERVRAAQRAATGRPFEDDQTVDSVLNEWLRAHNQPIIPGVFAENEIPAEGDAPPSIGPPVLDGEPLYGVILGRDIIAERESDGRYARNEQIPRGTRVHLTVGKTSLAGNVDPSPVPKAFRYADDSRTGIYEIDSRQVYVDFDLLQTLLSMDREDRVDEENRVVGTVPPRCSQIQIRLKRTPGIDVAAVAKRMEEVIHELGRNQSFDLDWRERRLVELVRVMTWEESQAHIIAPVEKEKVLVTILFGIISLVAVALVLCILYMIVLQKTRDIGIVKSLGGSSAGVAGIFVLYGAAVGVTGGILGAILGTIFVWELNDLQDLLVSIDPRLRMWDMKVYSFDRIPNEVDPWTAIAIVLIGIAAATVGSLAAAWRAGAMQPVEALRYE